VSDGNAYALGGIAGHAGLFSNAPDLWKLMTRWMWAPANDSWLNRTTAELWVKEYNHSQSSRALGWNTNDPNAPDQGWGLSCGRLSAKTFMHIGYTGTEMCGDPVNGVVTILLTNRYASFALLLLLFITVIIIIIPYIVRITENNVRFCRVYPSADNNKVGTYRRKFNDAVVEVLGLHGSSAPVLFAQEE
jgi:CubicO group peptidase (beta-lactamase class C family)